MAEGEQGRAAEFGAETARDATKWAGIGVGIGSAALVAALLYANRGKVAKAVVRRKPVEHED